MECFNITCIEGMFYESDFGDVYGEFQLQLSRPPPRG